MKKRKLKKQSCNGDCAPARIVVSPCHSISILYRLLALSGEEG